MVEGAVNGRLLPGAVAEIAIVDELAPRKGQSNARPAGPTCQVAPATLRRVPELSKNSKKQGRGWEDLFFTTMMKIPTIKCWNRRCGHWQIDGYLHCQECRSDMVEWTDARIATEVVRLERTAALQNMVFYLEGLQGGGGKWIRSKHHAKEGDKQGGISVEASLRKTAKTHLTKAQTMGCTRVSDRIDCQSTHSTPTDPGRTREERDKGGSQNTGPAKLDPHELNVSTEAYIAHHARFYTVMQFAVMCAFRFVPNNQVPIIVGHSGQYVPGRERRTDPWSDGELHQSVMEKARSSGHDEHRRGNPLVLFWPHQDLPGKGKGYSDWHSWNYGWSRGWDQWRQGPWGW